MHPLRNAITAGESPAAALASAKETNRRRGSGSGLAGITIAREERRTTDQRCEQRYRGLIERALVHVRGKKILARVVNISSGGLTLEAEVAPAIGERIALEIAEMDLTPGVVRWIRDGRIGIEVGTGTFAVD